MDYEELYKKLALNEYVIIYVNFRIKHTEKNGIEVFEFFPNDCVQVYGDYIDEQLIEDFFENTDNLQLDCFKSDGRYEGDFLFKIIPADDHTCCAWLEFLHFQLHEFLTIEEMLDRDLEYSILKKEAIENRIDDDLPF